MLTARLHVLGGDMVIEEMERPAPRPTDILIRVRACGIVPNLKNVLLNWPQWCPHLPLPALPASFGLDVAGEVAEVGSLVQHWKPGDRVYVTPGLFCGSCSACRADDTTNCSNFTFRGYFGFGPEAQRQFDAYPFGGMSEYITAPQHNLARLGDRTSFEQAARFGYLGTALAALEKAEAGPGKTILIAGITGTLGVGAALLAIGMGVTRILGVARNADLLERVRQLAPGRIRVLRTDDGAAIRDWAIAESDGDGPDAMIDCLGPGSLPQMFLGPLYALRRGGRAVSIGGIQEELKLSIKWLMDRQVTLLGSNWFSVRQAQKLADMAATGVADLSVFEHQTYPLSSVNEAIGDLPRRHGGFSNFVIMP
jgi:alcohol dehydrogenase